MVSKENDKIYHCNNLKNNNFERHWPKNLFENVKLQFKTKIGVIIRVKLCQDLSIPEREKYTDAL